jgi:hypothetical protein
MPYPVSPVLQTAAQSRGPIEWSGRSITSGFKVGHVVPGRSGELDLMCI